MLETALVGGPAAGDDRVGSPLPRRAGGIVAHAPAPSMSEAKVVPARSQQLRWPRRSTQMRRTTSARGRRCPHRLVAIRRMCNASGSSQPGTRPDPLGDVCWDHTVGIMERAERGGGTDERLIERWACGATAKVRLEHGALV